MPVYKINNKLCLFIHIPKCGGTTVEAWMRQNSNESFISSHPMQNLPCTPQHFHSTLLQHLFSSDHFDFVFTICRNPLDRLLSEYKYRMTSRSNRGKKHTPFYKWFWLNMSRYTQNKFHLDNHLRPQHEFIAFNSQIYRFENGIDNIIEDIANKLDISPPKQKHHKNKSQEINLSVSEKLVSDIYSIYHKDYEFFQYSKGIVNQNLILNKEENLIQKSLYESTKYFSKIPSFSLK